jgi:hypothetical protein
MTQQPSPERDLYLDPDPDIHTGRYRYRFDAAAAAAAAAHEKKFAEVKSAIVTKRSNVSIREIRLQIDGKLLTVEGFVVSSRKCVAEPSFSLADTRSRSLNAIVVVNDSRVPQLTFTLKVEHVNVSTGTIYATNATTIGKRLFIGVFTFTAAAKGQTTKLESLGIISTNYTAKSTRDTTAAAIDSAIYEGRVTRKDDSEAEAEVGVDFGSFDS